MENRKLIYFFGLLFSALFALLYYGLFHVILDQESEPTIVYYNQVGLYKSEENAQKVIKQLQDMGIDGYIFMNDDLHTVICGISSNQTDTQANGTLLQQQGLAYIEKQWTSEQEEVLNALEQNDITTVLEWMEHESKGNEQAGATS